MEASTSKLNRHIGCRPSLQRAWLIVLLMGLSHNAFAQHQPLPKVDSVTFTRLEGTPGNIQVVIRGSGMTGEWKPTGAMVGKTKLTGVVAFPDGKGLSGLLPPEPPDGGNVTIKGTGTGYASTGKSFSLSAVQGSARAPLDNREDCTYPVTPGKSIGPVKLGMTLKQLKKVAKKDPQSSVWYRVGPITAVIDGSGKQRVRLAWIDRPTLCLVEKKKKRKFDLPRPRTAKPAPFPYADCAWPTGPAIGGSCFECPKRGMKICHGAMGWYPNVKVMPAGKVK